MCLSLSLYQILNINPFIPFLINFFYYSYISLTFLCVCMWVCTWVCMWVRMWVRIKFYILHRHTLSSTRKYQSATFLHILKYSWKGNFLPFCKLPVPQKTHQFIYLHLKKHHVYFFAHTIRSEGNEVKEIALILPRRDFVYLMIDVNATFYCQLFLCQGYSPMTSYRSDVFDTDSFASSFDLISNIKKIKKND